MAADEVEEFVVYENSPLADYFKCMLDRNTLFKENVLLKHFFTQLCIALRNMMHNRP